MSFYRVGTEYPVGRIVTGRGLRLVVRSGTQVVTSASREREDDMWDGCLHVLGESTLDIVPALRKVEVTVKNKALGNLIDRLGFNDPQAWDDPYAFVAIQNATSLSFIRDDDHQSVEVTTRGIDVDQCNYLLTWEFGIQTYHSEWGLGYMRNPNESYTVGVHYSIRVVGREKTWSLAESGVWVQGDWEIVSEVKTGSEESIKIEIQGIPCDGEWRFFFRQTLIGKVHTYEGDRMGGRSSGHRESTAFCKMTLTMDADESYDKGLQYESLIAPANNVDLSVQLP